MSVGVALGAWVGVSVGVAVAVLTRRISNWKFGPGKRLRMYRPHAAREDTVLFPAFRKLVPKKQYGELGEQFEDKEHELFGKAGFGDHFFRLSDLCIVPAICGGM